MQQIFRAVNGDLSNAVQAGNGGAAARAQLAKKQNEARTVDSVLASWTGAPGSLHALIQEGHDLPAGAGGVRAEIVAAGAGGDALLDCPRHCISIVGLSGHIAEAVAGDSRGAIGTPQEGDSLAMVQRTASGLNVVAVVPLVMPFSAAHSTAS